jgi:CRP/FNR family transcriptional regulator, cyclic AMP receptor protein
VIIELLDRPAARPCVAGTGAVPGEALRVDERAAIQGGVWFSALSAPLRAAILGRAELRRVEAGTVLARRGDADAPWLGVARGAVRLGTSLEDGRSFTLDYLGAGQWFGDIAVVDGKPLALDVQAPVAASILLLSQAELRQLLRHSDELRDALLQLNCQRLRLMFHRFEELSMLTLAQRLARQVQRLAKRFGQPRAEGTRINMCISQSDLAALVGGSRQRVNQAWRQMQQRGIVERAPGALIVCDAAALEAVAQGRLALA